MTLPRIISPRRLLRRQYTERTECHVAVLTTEKHFACGAKVSARELHRWNRWANSRLTDGMMVVMGRCRYFKSVSVFTTRRYAEARSLLSPGVCPSATLVDCIETAEDIVKLLSQPGSSVILVIFDSQRRYPIPRGTPSAGTQNRRG